VKHSRSPLFPSRAISCTDMIWCTIRLRDGHLRLFELAAIAPWSGARILPHKKRPIEAPFSSLVQISAFNAISGCPCHLFGTRSLHSCDQCHSKIEACAITGCGEWTSLCRIEIPLSVQVIDESGFSQCTSFRKVTFAVKSRVRIIKGFNRCAPFLVHQNKDCMEQNRRRLHVSAHGCPVRT
jgi:hypothetical protein